MLFNEQHNEIRRTVARFVAQELNPHVEDWEEAGEMPSHEIMKKAGKLGLLGIDKPEAYGGLALDFSYQAVCSEELGSADHGSSPLLIGVHTMMSTPALARFGSDDLRREFLTPAIAGDIVTSIAVSEPHAGSDVAAIKTTARKEGDDYIINGTKMWITNSTQADFFCLLANTGDGPIHANKSLIIVPSNTPGVTVAPKLKKLGLLASMCKLKVGRLSQEVPRACLQYWGGMGFMWENFCARAMRDNVVASIGGGSDETMLSIISRMMVKEVN